MSLWKTPYFTGVLLFKDAGIGIFTGLSMPDMDEVSLPCVPAW
jgi:hypothetical protein